ncbi:unnamed protein product [Ophioblennius macclurei]
METHIDVYKHFSWLRKVDLCPAPNESYQDRLLRLEGDKESLVLQVSVLTDQVEAQGEKIRDLESSLEEHRRKLVSTEEMLQQELRSRTSLETQKLDLMDEVSYLKLKLVSMEDTHSHTHSVDAAHTQQDKAECVVNLISELQEQMCRFQEEISSRIQEKQALEEKEAGEGGGRVQVAPAPPPSDPNRSGSDVLWTSGAGQRQHEVKQLRSKVEELEEEKSRYEEQLRATQAQINELQQLLASRDAEIQCLQTQLTARGGASDPSQRDQEYQRLKVGMETLLASNDEKDRRIEELSVLLSQCRKTRDIMSHGSSEEELSGTLKMRGISYRTQGDLIRSEMSSRGSSPLLLSSSPYQRELDTSFQNSLMSSGDSSFLNGSCHRRRLLSSSLEELQSCSLQTEALLQLNKYQTLPGKLSRKKERGAEAEPDGGHVTAAPEEQTEATPTGGEDKVDQAVLSDASPPSSGMDSGQQSPVSPDSRKSHRGIRRLWGRIRRSQSGSPVQIQIHDPDPDPGDLRRGGYRATAGPRLDRSGKTKDLKTPFAKWTTEQVCDWLEDIGLAQYAVLARRWVNGGQTLLCATPQDLEKELAMKNPLHRKKLHLSIRTRSSKQPPRSAALDHIWVTRWLDDIGLPQYKDQFLEGRVDGTMLQYLTVSDLLLLKVTSQLHHLSIKCAIHVLHANGFDPNGLKRRPGNESCFSPSEVVHWSNHRVMEWLRSVDLAEYAPNLRGSGVHGALIMLEPRFSADSLALLLNISAQKTLLRRHLSTNFSGLVGALALQEKREYQEAAGSSPLSVTAKVKPKKSGFSHLTHLRRRRPDESTDYICPMDTPPSPPRLTPILDREPDRRRDWDRDQVGPLDSRAGSSP